MADDRSAPASLLAPLRARYDDLLARIEKYAFGNGQVAAPPCRKQGKYTFGGRTTQYPQLRARSTSGG